MPAALPPPPPAIVHIAPAVPSSGRHEVRAGETIGHIALDHDVVAETARKYGVSPSLALAVAWQESRWTNNALSDKGAIGAMQCKPLTGDYMGRLAGRPLNLWNVRDNATCGVLLLKSLEKETGSETAKLAAYYQGLDSLRKIGMYDDSWSTCSR